MAPRRKQAWTGWGAPAMKRVAGWDFDHRLNGYVTTAADRFSCDCGEEFDTPSGYRKCGSCGRAWNSYVIGTDSHGKEASLEKVIVREIPVRKDVIVASKRPAARRQAKGDCTCWDGYERVPGTKPCASGSCRKKEARRYVAWCRQVGRMPSTAGLRRFRTAERMVRIAKGDEPYQDFEYSPGMWRGIHNHYYYPERIPKIYDYDQFRKDNPDWFNPDGSPNPPPMGDSNPWSMSNRKIAPPMNFSPRSQYPAPNRGPEYGWVNHLYQHHTEDEIKQHWPEIPRDEWTGYPGADNGRYKTHLMGRPGQWKVYAPGYEFGQPIESGPMPTREPAPGYAPGTAPKPSGMPKKRRADRHNLRRKDLQEQIGPDDDQDEVTIEHFSSRRRRAELFDLDEEGGTAKGKGRAGDTPTMRKNPPDWHRRDKNQRWTK